MDHSAYGFFVNGFLFNSLEFLIYTTRLQRVLVNPAVFHDQTNSVDTTSAGLSVEIFWIGTQHRDVFERVAVDQQDIGERTFFDDAEISASVN